ncbi:hypothetical protein ASZ90_007556 [hydrocarbon metagenome]|uniref:Uncharacterized protein n=1 Tax=hydrocarbon metagenome TaxID=938273 RepID=A0A0W8FP07_9ZZZZ
MAFSEFSDDWFANLLMQENYHQSGKGKLRGDSSQQVIGPITAGRK